MKRRSLILVGFLVVLFMIPMSFGNVAATEYDYSSESVTSFSETLPDDVLFYPDAIEPQITSGNVSHAETNDYTETFVNDGTRWNNYDIGDDLYTYFDINGSFPVDTMHLEIDAIASGPIASHTLQLYLYNPQGTDLLVASKSEAGAGVDAVLNGWYNVTAWGYYEYDSKHTFYLFTTGSVNPTTILLDYFRLSFMTGASQGDPVLSEPYFATGGDTGFGNTYVVDASNFSVDGILEFSYDASNISSLVSFTYAIYGISAGTTFVHYSSDDVDYGTGPFDVITSEGWYNGTYNTALGALENTGIGYVWFATNSESSVNYMEISFTYIPVSGYGESFSDDSDWQEWVALEEYSADGDVITIAAVDSDYDRIYTNDISLSGGYNDYYLEVRYYCNVTGGDIRIYMYESDDHTGDFDSHSLPAGVGWQTYKKILDDPDTTNIESIGINARFANKLYKVDYLRIGPADEMGFQYDASTIHGIRNTTDSDFSFSKSSDGDIVTLSIEQIDTDTGTERFYFDYDDTDTEANIDTAYYPFFKMRYRVTSFVGLSSVSVRVYVQGGNYESFALDTSGSWNTTYFNADAFTNNDPAEYAHFRIYSSFNAISDKFTIELDYAKFYSIANFSYDDGGGESTNDYSYVASNGSLIVHTDTYTKWNHDPTLSVTIATYGLWSASTNADEYFRFRELGDTPTLWNQGITNGSLVGTTFDDFDILIYGPCTISSINFYGIVPSWNVITTVEIVFWVAGWHIISSIVIIFLTEISTYTINLLLLFLGLAMIPTSTILLVKGGRDEMSTDKLLVVILCFFMGWALFLGGIFV